MFAVAGAELGLIERLFRGSSRDQARALGIVQQATQEPELIASAAEALDVFDFEPVAKKKTSAGALGLPVDRHRRRRDDSRQSRGLRALGSACAASRRRQQESIRRSRCSASNGPTPIVINPVGSQRAFHPEGELAVARAAKAKDHLQVLSTVATTSIEDVIAARGAPVWFQLYHQAGLESDAADGQARRARGLRRPSSSRWISIGGSNRETMIRDARGTTRRTCTNCHLGGAPMPGVTGRVNERRDNRRKPMLAGLVPGTPIPEVGTPTWDYVKRLQDTTTMKVFIKGIVTREDAELAIEHGVNGDLRLEPRRPRRQHARARRSSTLPEVVAGARGRAPVIVDGGIPSRHGHLQGTRARRDRGGNRPALHLGTRRVRTGGRGDGAGAAAARAGDGDEAGGHRVDQAHHARVHRASRGNANGALATPTS